MLLNKVDINDNDDDDDDEPIVHSVADKQRRYNRARLPAKSECDLEDDVSKKSFKLHSSPVLRLLFSNPKEDFKPRKKPTPAAPKVCGF